MTLMLGDCLERMRELAENSIDAIVTDPPAGIGFMNKSWDSDKGGRDAWIAWMTEVMQECLRVLKPGGHALVWAIPRTSHWTATALENAGFEVRDVVTHLFGSGFPKSLNVALAIDKSLGASGNRGQGFNVAGQNVQLNQNKELRSDHPDYCPPTFVSDAAKQWQGWGTALKPASEHWILVRKPLSESTVAKNVLKHGVGGLNIDASRIATEDKLSFGSREIGTTGTYSPMPKDKQTLGAQNSQGRFPANLILDEQAAAALDEQSGTLKSGAHNGRMGKLGYHGGTDGQVSIRGSTEGGASRFFYVAKASKREKGSDNTHPTVKSLKLMEYLIKLIAPPEGIVLDPFMGSGSTGIAAKNLGFEFVGIERELEYFKIAQKRIPLS